jgi:energy-coupling factor transporter ATP-binding protein EcfA2
MENSLPIEHLSYSSLSLFCSNEQQFKKNYILGIWDFKESPSAIVGKAFHKCMELRGKGLEWDKAIEEGQKYIDSIAPSKVDFGKTGSLEQVTKEYYKTVEFFRAEEPDFGETLSTELNITTDFEFYSGLKSPLPLKVIIDRVSKLENKLRTWDYKVVSTFTDKSDEQPDYILQALFNYYGAKSKYGEAPATHTYLEIKKSKNSDGSKQVQAYEINFEAQETQQYFHLFEKLYTGAILKLADPNHIFLPNFSHPYSGKESWKDFVLESVDMEMPKEIIHKTSLVQFVDKKVEYQASNIDMVSNEHLQEHEKVVAKLLEFGIPLEFVKSYKAANVTLYTFKPSRGIKMSDIKKYESDLALALESKSIRILAPLMGTKYVGVEVGNKVQEKLPFHNDLLVQKSLVIPVGQDVYGKPYHLDLEKAPHLLVAGATGSGKSVFLNIAIQSLMASNTPESLAMILIDPKQTEFVDYEESPFLMTEIINTADEAKSALEWAIAEMERRYKEFKSVKVKNITEYNVNFSMGKVVIVIDELGDLMFNSETFEEKQLSDVTGNMFGETKSYKVKNSKFSVFIENAIVRLAQKARAAGIHLIIATQRPAVKVVTGSMKVNLPTRISFRVPTKTDSQVILDTTGAEQLLGNGDLLLMSPSERDLIRLQGYF